MGFVRAGLLASTALVAGWLVAYWHFPLFDPAGCFPAFWDPWHVSCTLQAEEFETFSKNLWTAGDCKIVQPQISQCVLLAQSGTDRNPEYIASEEQQQR